MSKDFIPMEEMYPLISEMLNIKGEVTFTVSGWSMQPMVYHRRDTVTLVKPQLPLKKYDLPFYLMDDGKFLLHRVIKVETKSDEDGKEKYIYTCQGDNRWEPEKDITDDMIIGVVKSFNRNGKDHSVDSFGYWLYTRTWRILHHFKWMYNYPKRTKEKFKRDFMHYKVTRKLRTKVAVDSLHLMREVPRDEAEGETITTPQSFRDSSPDKGSLRKSAQNSTKISGGKNMKIEYRQAKASDLKDFYLLYEDFFKDEIENYENNIANPEWIKTEAAKQYYNRLRQEQFFWLAVANGEIIGFCTGTVLEQKPSGIMIGTLVNIYVDERYRSMGIGAKLVETFKAYCKEYDCNNITVTFMEKNERAEKFYARHGFGVHKRTYICTTE